MISSDSGSETIDQEIGEQACNLRGWIYKPQGNGPFPAIVWNHGSEKNPVRHPELGMFYTGHGYVLFVPVREGHDGSAGIYIQHALKQFSATTKDPIRGSGNSPGDVATGAGSPAP